MPDVKLLQSLLLKSCSTFNTLFSLHSSSIMSSHKKTLFKCSWAEDFPDYKPTEWSSEVIVGQVWADPDIGDPNFKPKFNQKDGDIDRRSHTGAYEVLHGYPLNPCGRTGTRLRGVLGRWGPNHAADPVVTKWRSDSSGHKILSVVLIKRRDNGSWSTPGGFIDAGEDAKHAASREFLEEANDILSRSPEERKLLEAKLKKLFDSGIVVWKDVVRDGRNTDNAWIESVGIHFHDESGLLDDLPLKAGDDAADVKWVDVAELLATPSSSSQVQMIRKAAERLNAT